ncbi:ATP-dependent RNA helicase SUV3 [Aspergillus homomorphus CBS 101889]|uniref:RNA helicase n=1 Tax=Aspergillus homomorphus (strain CBS 101889) TaxID=1450537 RepID=A0A395HZW0_ASPHC|nr:putative mitochondrial ATP-dependent RNA helicase Suv3 [Aspergillus homomorphus CBS 101889]RAL13025.1 putative mitochondrial ATP-dependent RNA helicase Suv3 [Aspergillus homomorphus CBS 101889]
MRLWSNRGSQCLLCILQPTVRPATRTFATSPVLQRSKPKKKKSSKSKPTVDSSLPYSPHNRRRTLDSNEFEAVVKQALESYRIKVKHGEDSSALEKWDKFERQVQNACKSDGGVQIAQVPGPLRRLRSALHEAFLNNGIRGLNNEFEFQMYSEDITAEYGAPNQLRQQILADLRYPAEQYPQARAVQRTIHLHVGPTNSGKTYHALKRLEASGNGFYAGPLRLLAQEVYQRFKTQEIPCSLITGDDVKIHAGEERAGIVSNTVEMVSLGQPYEVGVIDEIQMISDTRRGWAWTRAVLGARVKELHLCGETRAVPLIRDLAALTGDKLEIHRYERLNPLRVAKRSLRGDLRNLQKGDCIVSFSRVGIHALKAEIEKTTGKRAAIVYGSLPAEIRTQQASLFNDPNNDYDFLVASDAIGMGLNLSCKRIIFETVIKKLPQGLVRLTVPEVKQIGGRAGRYRPAVQHGRPDDDDNVGWVTSLEDVDLPYIKQAMEVEPPPLVAAGLHPPDHVFQKFAAYYPTNTPLEYLIKRILSVAKVHPLFFLCDPRNQLENAAIIDAVDGLRMPDQLTLMAAPMYVKDIGGRDAAIAFTRCVAENSNGHLLNFQTLNLEILEEEVSGRKEYTTELESLHKSIVLYLWLSFRFGGIFTDRTLAGHVKELLEERMVRALTEFSANKKLRKDSSLRRQIALQKQSLEQQLLLAEEADRTYGGGGTTSLHGQAQDDLSPGDDVLEEPVLEDSVEEENLEEDNGQESDVLEEPVPEDFVEEQNLKEDNEQGDDVQEKPDSHAGTP